jgi:hypothetical protein
MDRFQSLSANRLLFDLAARMGSLEGYLYAEERVDPKYLPNWLQHIEEEFHLLLPAMKNELRPDYLALLQKIQDLLQKAYGDQDPNTMKAAAMIGHQTQAENR